MECGRFGHFLRLTCARCSQRVRVNRLHHSHECVACDDRLASQQEEDLSLVSVVEYHITANKQSWYGLMEPCGHP